MGHNSSKRTLKNPEIYLKNGSCGCGCGSTAADEQSWLENLKYFGIAAIVLGLPRIILKAVGAVRNGVLDINCLVTLATCGAIGTGD